MLTLTVFATEQPAVCIKYSAGETRFDFYRLADFSEKKGLTVTETFSNYKKTIPLLKDIEKLNAEQSRILASTMEAVIIRDQIQPIYSEESDSKGVLSMVGLKKGVYLVLGHKSDDGEYVYIPSPLIVSIPDYDVDGKLQYDVTIIHNKVEKRPLDDSPTKYKVVKVWKDLGAEKKRPREINVSLFKDGIYEETIILNKENNWCYEWTELDSGVYYTAIEEAVPTNYTMTLEKERACFYIKNTYDNPKPPDLPATGQLWWPVPLCIVVGIISLAFGLKKR
jgi:hypothetical protein